MKHVLIIETHFTESSNGRTTAFGAVYSGSNPGSVAIEITNSTAILYYMSSNKLQKPQNSTIINVCIIPPQDVGDKCIEISKSLESKNTAFVLGDGKFAHMTVFMARFEDGKINAVVQAIENSLQMAHSFRCEQSGYFLTEGRYMEVSYRRSKPFMDLHESLITNLSDLRINPGNPFEEGYFTPYTEEQRKNAEETGYDLARNLYRPHITLTRYKENEVSDIFSAFPEAKLSFNVNQICVYKADDNGAVYERVKSFQIT